MRTFRRWLIERVDAPQNSTLEIARAIIAEFDKYRSRYGGGGSNNNVWPQHLKIAIEDVLGDYLGQPNPSGQPLTITLSSNTPVMFDTLRQSYKPVVGRVMQMVGGNAADVNQDMLAKALDASFS